MSYLRKLSALMLLSTTLTLGGCGITNGGGNFNLFPPEQDKELGQQVAQEIENNPQEYPILPERGNEEVYQFIRGMTQRILNTGKVAYRDEFAWQVKIIDDDETLNAFAAPGGYIYVYTGLIKFLDTEAELAGVMGHEIAHAALRHSTSQMSKIYGISALASIITGSANPGLLQEIALGLINLTFSRSNEREADTYSVIYLCETDYAADGAAGFFEKMEGAAQPPTFLSTHPNPDNRIENIHEEADSRNCGTGNEYPDRYARIKRLLN